MKIKEWFYNGPYDVIYSLYFSAKDLVLDLVELLKDLKRPKTWSYVLVILTIYAFITQKNELFRWIIPGVVLLYTLRQRIEGKYIVSMKHHALKTNNMIIIKKEYEKYKKDCFYSKKVPKDFIEWKQLELAALKNDK